MLSDIIESLIGAVWVDTNGDLTACWQIIQVLLAPLPSTIDDAPLHPVRAIRVRMFVLPLRRIAYRSFVYVLLLFINPIICLHAGTCCQGTYEFDNCYQTF